MPDGPKRNPRADLVAKSRPGRSYSDNQIKALRWRRALRLAPVIAVAGVAWIALTIVAGVEWASIRDAILSPMSWPWQVQFAVAGVAATGVGLFVVRFTLDHWRDMRAWLELVGVVGIGVAIVALTIDIDARRQDRAVNLASVLAQLAQTHALPGEGGLRALRPSVELLVAERLPLVGINLSGADLAEADLGGADLSGANLTGANLAGANLARANLAGANLTEANLTRANLAEAHLAFADLTEARLSSADLSGADVLQTTLWGTDLTLAEFRGADLIGMRRIESMRAARPQSRVYLSAEVIDGAIRLAQELLDTACALPGGPPMNLQDGLEWRGGGPCLDGD